MAITTKSSISVNPLPYFGPLVRRLCIIEFLVFAFATHPLDAQRQLCVSLILYAYVNLDYLAKHSIIHPNLVWCNSEVAQSQRFFEEAAEQDRPIWDVIDSVIKPHKY